MDITKRDSKMLKGVAILAMLMLHLFCRKENLPYIPLLWIGDTPLIYYFGLFGDICVAMYCFVSGYVHYLQSSKAELQQRWRRLLRFMIPFWVIAVVFSLAGILIGNATIPGSIKEFLLNCLTIKNSYNGAWWYANTYILLVVLQPLSRKYAARSPTWLVILSTFAFYAVGYGIRFWGWGACDSVILSWIIVHIGLLGTSYFPYAIGMLFCKKQIVSLLRQRVASCKDRNIYFFTAMTFACMIIMHGFVQSLFVSVITATVTIILLCVCPLPRWVTGLLCYFGEHSTNIWLAHMFFYTVLFDGFVFRAKYPILVFLLLLAVSLASSYAIKCVSKPILKLVR
ncbi:MAG: acyltransferase family protein [Eubacteriales bacterium]|nr:acyltransferase family protein [Eubacteriales bacterium]